MLVAMHLLTRGLFSVAFERRKIAGAVLVLGVIGVAGELLLPSEGAAGLISRAAALCLVPPALVATGAVAVSDLRSLLRLRRAAPRPA